MSTSNSAMIAAHLPWRPPVRSSAPVCAPGGERRRGCPAMIEHATSDLSRKPNYPQQTWLLGAYCPSWWMQARVAETMLRWESITPFGLPSNVSPNAASLWSERGQNRSKNWSGSYFLNHTASIVSILGVRPKTKGDLRLKPPGEADGGCRVWQGWHLLPLVQRSKLLHLREPGTRKGKFWDWFWGRERESAEIINETKKGNDSWDRKDKVLRLFFGTRKGKFCIKCI